MSCPYQLSQHRLVGHHFFETTGMWRIPQVMLLIDFLLDGGADAKVFGFHTSQEHARICENMRRVNEETVAPSISSRKAHLLGRDLQI